MPSDPKKRYPNSGILSRNQRAGGNPNAAPYAGSLDIDCPHCRAQVEMWINAWVKDGARGKFFSLRFKEKNAAPKGPIGPAHGPTSSKPPAPAAQTPPTDEPSEESSDEDYRY